MKRLVLACCFFTLSSAGVYAAPLVHSKEKLQEAAAFSLGVKKADVTIEESDHSPEPNTEYFMAKYKGKEYQCYVQYLQKIMTAAPCMPTDGSALPGSNR